MPDIPVYSYEDLRKKADDFLRKKIKDKGISMEKNWDFA